MSINSPTFMDVNLRFAYSMVTDLFNFEHTEFVDRQEESVESEDLYLLLEVSIHLGKLI